MAQKKENQKPEENKAKLEPEVSEAAEKLKKAAQTEPEAKESKAEAAAKKIIKDKEPEQDYQAIIEGLNDKLLRSAAEMQNVKRRAEIDVQKARHFSIESFAKDLLGVMDNLYRATDSISAEDESGSDKVKAIKEGVEITKKELANVFERNGIKRIDPKDEKFDHNLHQAMSQVPIEGKESGTVIEVMQTGYVIKDRLLRPALVVVAK